MNHTVIKEFIARGCLLHALTISVGGAIAEEREQLEQITVTPDQEPSSLETAPPLGYHIDRKTMDGIPGSGSDPLRAIQALPGVTVNDDTSADPAIRGSRPEDNSYFVDFLPAGYLFHAGGTVSVFNAQVVESFDYYPAAYGAEYNGGTGAVIDTRLRDPRNDEFTTTIDVSVLQGGVLFEGPLSAGHSFYLAGRMSYMDLIIEDIVEDNDDDIEFVQFPRYTDYQGKYLWRMHNGSRLRVQATGASDEMEITLDSDSDTAQKEPVLVGTHSNDTAYHSQGIVWESSPGIRETTLATGHMSSKTRAQAAAAGDWQVETNTWFAKGRWTQALGSEHLIAVGGEVSRFKVDYELSFRDTGCTEFDVDCSYTDADQRNSDAQVEVTSEQLYIEENWYPNQKLAITAGLSGKHEDYLDETFVEPRLRIEISQHDGWTYSAGFGRYHQMPSLIRVEKVFGNPQLSHFDATHYVTGIEYLGADGWEWKSELYYKDIDNLVSSDPVTRYNNSGEGKAAGVELFLRKTRTDRWSGWLSLALSKAERTDTATGESFPFEYDQPVAVTLVGNYHINSKWELGAKWWYHSGAPYTPIIGSTEDTMRDDRYRPVYGDINSERMPNYHRLDLRLSRRFSDNTAAYVELINAYGKKNVSGYEYNADYSDRDPIYQLPMLISFGVRSSF
ncbi:MAG: TonB-dependent receptor [Candidatus Thiodiazotropha lotti]